MGNVRFPRQITLFPAGYSGIPNMSKTTYWLCAINTVASAIALFLIFRSPAKLNTQHPLQLQEMAGPTKPTPSVDEIWQQFEQAGSTQTAINSLAQLPNTADSIKVVETYIAKRNSATLSATDFASIGRQNAAIQFLGATSKWDGPVIELLKSIAKDKKCYIILRDKALRAVIDIAFRQNKANDAANPNWRSELTQFLFESDFGNETSMSGLALQAAAFIHLKGIAKIDENTLKEKLRTILENQSTVQESTLIASLEVIAQTAQTDLSDRVRLIAQKPRSDAVLQASIVTLGKIGTKEDQAWLAQLPHQSAAIYLTAETAWANIQP